MQKMNRKTLTFGLLILGTVALAGAAWVSAQGPAVGEGSAVHVMLTPT
jgi:hypothetical protein